MPTMSGLQAWLRSFAPAPFPGSRRELVLGSVGAGLGLLLAEWLSHLLLGHSNPWFVAPMAATAVLVFAIPASPFAQPWAVLLGNVLSALVGVACYQWLGAAPATAALATASAVAVMAALRCLHPPGGAVALTAVLGGPAINAMGFSFAGWLVAVNSLLLLALAVIFHPLAGRRYPHVAPRPAHGTADPRPNARLLPDADLEAALAAQGDVLDVDLDDLRAILARARLQAGRRHWADLRSADVMARDVVTVRAGEPPAVAWRLLARHRLGALPVVDAGGRLRGIVAPVDFLAVDAPRPVLRPADRVDHLMIRDVRVARPDTPLADLVELFTDGGMHHLPVVDADHRVVGVLTQSDVVAALFEAAPGDAPRAQPAPATPGGETSTAARPSS